MEHIVIIGNGISGVTAARHIRKNSNNKITIVSAESKYFFSRTALMYVYMGHMKFEPRRARRATCPCPCPCRPCRPQRASARARG